MDDNFNFTPGSGGTGAAKNNGGVLYPKVILNEDDGTDTALAAKLGALTETAPTSDTGSSGLNGRLQRIAQRLTTLIGSTIAVSGTFWQATQPVSLADGSSVTLGAKADAKSTATDTTSITIMQVLKQVSASVQATAASVAGTLTVASHAVTNAGTFAVQAAITAASGAIASGAVASGAVASGAFASGSVSDGAMVTIGAKADAKSTATDTTSITIMSVLKQVSASVQAAASSLSGTLTVASHAVTNAGTFAVQAAVTAALSSIVDGAIVTLGAKADAKSTATDTTSITIMSVLKQISASVQAPPSQAVTNAGTFAVQLATNTPVGTVAHDGADSGAPIKVGGRARSSEITAVSSDDRTDFVADLTGKQIVLPYANPENFVSGAITSAMTGTTSTSLVNDPGVGLRNYITTLIVSNSHATVGTDVIIQDGSGGTTLLTIPAASVYGGSVINLPVPLRQPTAHTALYCANVTTGASTKVSAVGYKGA